MSGPENMENKLSPLAEEVSSLELAESPWVPDQLLVISLQRNSKAGLRGTAQGAGENGVLALPIQSQSW